MNIQKRKLCIHAAALRALELFTYLEFSFRGFTPTTDIVERAQRAADQLLDCLEEAKKEWGIKDE